MSLPRIVVVGAGPGGLAAAGRLRDRGGGAVEVVMVTSGGRATHLAGTLDVALGVAAPERFEAHVGLDGVTCMSATVTRVAADGVELAPPDAGWLAADAVIAAPGLALDFDAIPPWPRARAGWDPRSVAGAAEALMSVRAGRILVAVLGAPYRCPPAPFSLAIRLADLHFHARHMTRVAVATPEPFPLAAVGGEAPGLLMDACAGAGVAVECGFVWDPATSEDGVLRATDGRELRYDAAFLVPPHRRAACLEELPGDSALVSPGTSRLRVVGDAAATGLPRAAGFAEALGAAAADAALADLGIAAAAEPVSLAASCFVAHWGGAVSRIAVAYPEVPPPDGTPVVTIDGPSLDLAGGVEGARRRFLDAAADGGARRACR